MLFINMAKSEEAHGSVLEETIKMMENREDKHCDDDEELEVRHITY